MPKNLFQDMVKIKHANREAQTPREEASTASFQDEVNFLKKARLDSVKKVKSPARPPKEEVRVIGDKRKPRYAIWVVAAISIVFFIYSISFIFAKVIVTVNPKIKDVVLNENLSATKDAAEDALPFDLVVISGEENKIVQTTEEKDVSDKARGVVVIYNAFSSAGQRLDIDTRLEGSNGKIYKTEKAAVVPGMKDGTPGSVEVGIYASSAGGEYNSEPLDFTIFGFKGTPKYSKFYARSKGKISGGFIGKAPVISEADKLSAINDLKIALQAKLLQKATGQIPSGFILFKDAVILNIDESNVDLASASGKSLPIKLKGTLYGFLLDEVKLTKKIAEKKVDGYDGSPVYIPNIRDLNFSLSAQTGGSGVAWGDMKNINFNLKGSKQVVYKLDEGKLVADLLNKSRKDFNQVLLQYPNIASADLVISPFWKMSFPSKAEGVKVIVNYPK